MPTSLDFQRDYIIASLAEYAPDKNLVIGPNSAELQLALLASGTAGNSFHEIVRALKVDVATPRALLQSDYLADRLQRREDLNRDGDKAGTWARSCSGLVTTRSVSPAFAQPLQWFGAQMLCVTADDNVTAMVNAWVAKATATPSTPAGLINPLLRTPLPPLTDFIALTADAFEMAFTWPFDPRWTKEASFTSGDTDQQPCDLMRKRFSWDDGAMHLTKADGTEVAVLPYGNPGAFALRLTKLPAAAAGRAEAIADWYGSQMASPVTSTAMAFHLLMPRADIGGERDSRPTRNRLGIETIYGEAADFSTMLSEALPGDPYIAQSVEAISLKINEIKTEGAVVQADMAVRAGGIAPPCPSLRLDSTYLAEVVFGDGRPSTDRREDILLFAIVNKPGRLPPPVAE